MSANEKTPASTPYTWAGRFDEPMSELVKRYTASVDFDQRLWQQDIRGSLAHARMLAKQSIISAQDLADIERGMTQILGELERGEFTWSLDLEDVHLNIEHRLTSLVGDAGKRLHTGRSRNDQVATDIRLWLRDSIDILIELFKRLQLALVTLAEQHAATPMPGFTHLQVAQPVTFGHHLMAYVEMLGRDRSRFEDARRRMNECPLGAAALAGTSFVTKLSAPTLPPTPTSTPGTSALTIGSSVAAPRIIVSSRPRAWSIRSVKIWPRSGSAASWISSSATNASTPAPSTRPRRRNPSTTPASGTPNLSITVRVSAIGIIALGLIGRMRGVALVVPEPAIDAVPRQQLCMRAALDRLAARNHDDLVHFDHRGQAVRRPDHGAPLRHPQECAVDRGFRGLVERGGRLVEQQDRRVLHQRAGNRHALFFAAGEFQPAFAHLRVKALGQAADQVHQRGGLGGSLYIRLPGAIAAIGNVVADGFVGRCHVFKLLSRGHAAGPLRAECSEAVEDVDTHQKLVISNVRSHPDTH